jgi:serine/threonine-protein kinase
MATDPHPDATLDYVAPLQADLGQTQEISGDTKPIPLAGDPTTPKSVIKLTQLGDFRLLAKLGQGGMGTVFRAEQISKKRLVALKVMSKELTAKPGYVARFHREVRAMAKVDHPNLVRCFAAGESHGFIYLAMELVDGGSLGDRLKDGQSLPPAEACRIVRDIANGLQAAHEAGLIHRDIKPDNILMTSAGQPKIADLGLAKTADGEESGLTQTGIGIGTPLYAPLEQIKDAKNVDVRCDLFALGGLFYHLLVGRPPFEAESLLGMIKAKDKGTYTFASLAKPGVPDAVDRMLLKLLAKLPDQRYPSAAEFVQDLELSGLAGAA